MRHIALLPLLFLLALGQTAVAAISLTPNPLVLSVKSGESTSAAMTLTNTDPSSTSWTLEINDQNNRADTLEGALAAINASGTVLNGTLPARYDFTAGETGTYISSGAIVNDSSIFSSGNKLNTSLGGPLAYSNDVVTAPGSGWLGTGGRYFTRKLPGLFLFAADLNGPTYFEVAGSITYGNSRQISEFSITRNGKQWSAFVSKTADYWRTINHLILVDQTGLTQTVGTSNSDEKQRISGLTGKRRIYHLLYVTSTTSVQPDSVFTDLAGRLLDVVPLPLSSMLSITPSSGTAAAGSKNLLSVTANAFGFTPGTYNFNLNVKNTIGTLLNTVPVSFEITPPRLAVPAVISQTTVAGVAAFTVDVPVTSNLPQAQPWTASITSAPAWLSLVNTSGSTPDSLKLRFNPGTLATGTYRSMVTVTSGSVIFNIPVQLNIVTFNVTKLVPHPGRPIVYGINTSLVGEGACVLLEIEAATAKILRTLPIGLATTDAALDAATGRLYIANLGYPQSKVIDVDAWAELPSLNLGEINYLETVTGGRLATLGGGTGGGVTLSSASTGMSLGTLNSFYGNIAVPFSGDFLYLAGSGTSGSNLKRYHIDKAGFTLDITGPQIGYGSSNLVLSGDGKRLFWLGRTLDEGLNILSAMPLNSEVYATNQTGDLAIGETTIWWSDSGTPVATLPFTSKVAAVSANDAYLVRFNATTKALQSTAISTLTDLPGSLPRPGQRLNQSPNRLAWSPVAGATAYRVYLAADTTALQAMTMPTTTVVSPYYDLPVALPFGRFYTWRVDAVIGNAVTAGKIQTFFIRFPQGPELAPSTQSFNAMAAAAADGSLLLGFGNSSTGAQHYDFDATNGATKVAQIFSIPGDYYEHHFGSSVTMDNGKPTVGAYGFDSPVSEGGAIYTYRADSLGYWQSSGPITPSPPVVGEGFGLGLASSGNLLLAGTGNVYSYKGRVVAYITEPENVQTQVFSASDAVVGDGFGKVIVMEGNRAIISAPGNGSSYNRIGCLYSFTRSPITGLWSQTQKITIPVATSEAGNSLAMAGGIMVTRVSNSAVAVFTESGTNLWTYATTIDSSAVTGASSYSFGSALALYGDQLFIGDTGASYNGVTGGVVFSFRRSGSNWIAGPVITPDASWSGFGRALAAREGWLLVAGEVNGRPGSIFRVDSGANRMPRFVAGLPTQVVSGRTFSIPIKAEDADGKTGLVITKLQGPSWLTLTDKSGGEAILSGTPNGAPGSTQDVQLSVRDAAGAQVLWTYRLTILAPTDVPTLTQEPVGSDFGVGQEVVLKAAVSGKGPFQWQWYRDGVPISGANSGNFSISEVTLANAGSYSVKVSNAVGEDVSAAVAIGVHPADRFAGDWPTFGSSPAHTGHHPAALDTCHFIPAWSRTVQSGYTLNRAAIAKDRAFVVPSGNFASNLAAVALDLQTGNPLWSFPFPSSYSSNPPSVYNDRIYFQRGKGTNELIGPQLFSLNADTGKQVWSSVFAAQFESYEAPAVSDLGIFINGGTYGGMYGFNSDGSQRFFKSLPQIDRRTPTIANNKLYSWVAGVFQEHNPYDGSILWTLNAEGYTYNVSAISNDSAAVIGTDLVCIDLPSRSIRWRSTASYSGSPAITSNYIFAILGNTVRSFSVTNGSPSVIYQTDAPVSNTSVLLSQPIVFNDRLVISSETKTWIFNLADGALLQTLNAGGRLSYSDGYLLLAGNDGVMRAFKALHYNANLTSLALNNGIMVPGFATATTEYIATVPYISDRVTLTPTTELSDASVTVNGVTVKSGTASGPINLAVGNNTLTTIITAEDGITTKTYTIVVTRLPMTFTFNSGKDVPITASGFSSGGYDVNCVLNYPPAPGTILTIINNTGLGFIQGVFGNLAQGQYVTLSYGGKNYGFVVNYFGGTGNDLVLQWAANAVVAWGSNNYGQLGDGGTVSRSVPTLPDGSGMLSGRTVTAISGGYLHSLALCSDGTLATWGYNSYGQLGNGGTVASSVPVAVDRKGALVGKTVIAISAGPFHNLALCADGTIAAWGYNNYGQLGDGTKVTSRVPVSVNPSGALTAKHVVAVMAGAYHSFALCDDGTVAGWGYNDEGELGNGSTTGALIPVPVNTSGALSGKRVSAVASGQYHTLALCTDGTLVAWGYNNRGQLGTGSTAMSGVPVLITSKGILAGKTVVSVSASSAHSLAMCADGTLAAWGYNNRGQLGTGTTSQSTVPVAVDLSGVASGRTSAGIAGGWNHSLMRFTDGSLAAWGDNAYGQLGDGSTTQHGIASTVNVSSLSSDSCFMMMIASSSAANHSLSVAALPQPYVLFRAALSQKIANGGILSTEDLLAYAFGLVPGEQITEKLPQMLKIGETYQITFTQPTGVVGITYGAEWCDTLLPGSWIGLPDSGTDGQHIFTLPQNAGPKAFMRLKVVQH